MAYQTTSIYKEKVYNEDARHKLKILFNGVEYQNIDRVCEKLTINSRIIPNGNTNFALDNFISKEATLILHNVDLEDIVDPVEIQIGTLTNSDGSLGDTYEYVPIGIFNIQDIPTTDKDKTTITLRDNAIKFDFPYNAEPLIEGNGGSATKMQIFQDICTQAGVGTNVSHFLKDDELFGGYDNNISGRQYIAYLAEQAGAIAIINRYGNLDFIYLNNLEEQELPLQFVESYQNGDPLEISKVIYESGVIKYECGNETHDTLFLDASNPYINDQDVMLETNDEEIIIKDNKSNFQIFKKDGKCEQDGTPTPSNPIEIQTIKPINMFNGEISDGRWTYTVGQTISSNTSLGFRSTGYIDIKPNTTYIFSGTFTDGDVFIVETNASNVILAIDGNNGYKRFSYVANVWSYMSFTSHSNAKRLYWYNSTGITRPNDIMIEKQFLDEYIPYGSIAIENTSSKNLLKREGYATTKNDGTYWENASGNYMTPLENGFCNVTIDNSSGGGNVFCDMWIRPTQFEKLKAGGNYTAFVEMRNVEKTGSADFVLHQLDGTSSDLWLPTSQKTKVAISNTIIRFNFNVSNDLNGKNAIFRSYVRAYPNSKINCDLRLSIYEGSVSQEDFEYQMYGKKRTLINLQGNELCSIGDVKDELIIDNGNAKIIKRIGKNVLNGNEIWARQNTNAGYRYRILSATIKPTESTSLISNIISSHFEATSANWTWVSRMGIAVDHNAFLYICYENESVDTLEKFKTWLQSNNVIVYYELNEPQEIDLGEIEVQNFEGYNDIYTNDNIKSNMYIKYASTKPQIEFIYDILNGFKINSFKTGKILGNPAIDPYDIISVTDGDNTYKTLATNTLTYNGKLIQTFDTQVKIGDKQSNVSLMGEPTFQRYAKTNIDNINNNLTMVVAQQNETTQQMSQVIQTVNSIQNTFQVTGGNNLIKDSQGLLGDDVWTKLDGGNYVMGYDADLIGKTISSSKLGISNGKMTSTSENITGLVVGMQYTLSYKISNDTNTTTRIKLTGNNVAYDKTFNTNISFQEETFSFIAETSTYTLEIESSTTMDGYGYIYDLMLNKGDALSWEPASGEIVGTVLKMSQLGLQINCTGSDIATLMTSQGFQVRRYSNGTLYEIVTEFTSSGLKTKKAEMTELLINNFEWKQIRYQGNDTLILYKKESD